MITVDEALRRVLEAVARLGPLPEEPVPLVRAAGRVLRETVMADRDMPPFTRSAMDGYALRAADAGSAPAILEVIEKIPAGQWPRLAVGPGQASKIMTGAALPEGADAVQMIEKTEPAGDDLVRVLAPVAPGEHVRRAGEDLPRGSMLLESGVVLGPVEIALLASAGRPHVVVSRRPKVAILPTGDELVSVEQEPGPAQIRESNGRALEVLTRQSGGEPAVFGIVRDEREELRARIEEALEQADVVLLSGGVSMGDYDLVGKALQDLGCQAVFERVAIQPGKPLFFGMGGRRGDKLVFGLPGNPVSTIVDFLVFARPALRRMTGASTWIDATIEARLGEPLERRPGRRSYLPARIEEGSDHVTVRLLASMGSADVVSLSRADALAIIPEGIERLDAGFRVRALPLALTRMP
jgi:molybdopterin molybdotransferase